MCLQTWNITPDVSETFEMLSKFPVVLDDSDIDNIERYVVLLYDRSCSFSSVNEARKSLFTHKNSQFDMLPPTRAALLQHIYRAADQSGIVWGQALQQQPQQQSPDSWGWRKNDEGTWSIHWTDLQPISDMCKELCKCGCKQACRGRCSCKKSNLHCTSICNCPCLLTQA